jgi:hypothetical protein
MSRLAFALALAGLRVLRIAARWALMFVAI